MDAANGTAATTAITATTATSVDFREKGSNGSSSTAHQRQPQKSKAKRLGTPALQQKYRHVAAVHSVTRPSTLSHDSVVAPSFLGFRNLMVIVLGKLHFTLLVSVGARLISLSHLTLPLLVVGNLRLMIENMQKV